MISILKLVELGGLHSAGCLYDILANIWTSSVLSQIHFGFS